MEIGDRVRLPNGSFFGRITAIDPLGVIASFPFDRGGEDDPFKWKFHAGGIDGDRLIVGEPLAKFLRVPSGSVLLVIPDAAIQTSPGSSLEGPLQKAFRLAHG
ncbi:MAG: hypothetical protein RLZZ627_1261 [Pseudomonadota bacterium]|jgi:hypothetical protein